MRTFARGRTALLVFAVGVALTTAGCDHHSSQGCDINGPNTCPSGQSCGICSSSTDSCNVCGSNNGDSCSC